MNRSGERSSSWRCEHFTAPSPESRILSTSPHRKMEAGPREPEEKTTFTVLVTGANR